MLRAVPQPEVDGSADEHHRVRLYQPITAAEAAQVGVVGRDATASHGVQEHRRVNHLHELAQFLRSVAPPYVGPGQNHGPFSGLEDIHDFGDVFRVSISLGLCPVSLGITNVILFTRAVDHIYRNLQIGGTGDAGSCLAESFSNVFGDSLDPLHLLGELGDRLHERYAVEVLETALEVFPYSRVSPDKDHWTGGLKSVGQRGDGVGNAGAGGNNSHARLAGYFSPTFRRVTRHLFMAEVNHLDAFIHTTFVQVVNMPAVQGKYEFNPFML